MDSRYADVLAANESFYAAFSAGDVQAMSQCWARHTPVACIHPGWPAVLGRESVLRSWAAVLHRPPPLSHSNAKVYGEGSTAVVLCRELIGDTELAATNVFIREAGVYRLIHHQAGPVAVSHEDARAASEEPLLN